MAPSIVLGTQVLQQFISHVELLPGGPRAGLAPRYPPIEPQERAARRAASCAARKRCMGQQRYAAARNECEQPVCSAFFARLDPHTGVCQWHGPFRVTLAILLAVFGGAELTLQLLHAKLPERFAREASTAPVPEVRRPPHAPHKHL